MVIKYIFLHVLNTPTIVYRRTYFLIVANVKIAIFEHFKGRPAFLNIFFAYTSGWVAQNMTKGILWDHQYQFFRIPNIGTPWNFLYPKIRLFLKTQVVGLCNFCKCYFSSIPRESRFFSKDFGSKKFFGHREKYFGDTLSAF